MGRENRPNGSPEPGGSFEQRLSKARSRQGLDTGQASSSDATDGSSLGLVLRVGVELVSAVIVGLAIGWGLDAWLGTRPLFLILFVFLGGVAGIVDVWRLVAAPSGGSRSVAAKTGAAKRPPG